MDPRDASASKKLDVTLSTPLKLAVDFFAKAMSFWGEVSLCEDLERWQSGVLYLQP